MQRAANVAAAELTSADDDDDAVTTEYRRPDWVEEDSVTRVNLDRPLLPAPPAVPSFTPKG